MNSKTKYYNKKILKGLVLGILFSCLIICVTEKYLKSDSKKYIYERNDLASSTVLNGIDYSDSISYATFETRVTSLESQIYPVGSVYISTTKSTAAQVKALFGGTWEAIGQGRVLVGAGTGTDGLGNSMTFSAGSTGGSTTAGNSSSTQTITNPLGEYTHKLVVSEMPSHNHTFSNTTNPTYIARNHSDGSNNYLQIGNVSRDTSSAGSDYYHNNIQPYLVVYMYKRTA